MTTSRMRSGGTPARITLPARVARNETVSEASFTRNASGVPGFVDDEIASFAWVTVLPAIRPDPP